MDGIQTYTNGPRPLVATVHSSPNSHASTHSTASAKSVSDYLRAVRRRIWLVLAIAIPCATTGTLLVLRLPAIYQVKSQIEVKQPRVDPNIDKIVGNGSERAEGVDEKFVQNALALLKSKNLVEEVLRSPTLGQSSATLEESAVNDLIGAITVKPIAGSHQFIVTLEGKDPDRITITLNFLLDRFRNRIGDKTEFATGQAKTDAEGSVTKHMKELEEVQIKLGRLLTNSKSLSTTGRNLTEARYDALTQQLYFQKQQAMGTTVTQQMMLAKPEPEPTVNPVKAGRIASLEEKRRKAEKQLKEAVRVSKKGSDPSIRRYQNDIADIDAELAELEDRSAGPIMSPAEMYQQVLANQLEGIKDTENQREQTLIELKRDVPDQHEYGNLMEERANLTRQITDLKKRISEFELLSKSRNHPVEIIDKAFEPSVPVKPNRLIYIAACIIFSFSVGLGLVCFLEHIDHSVKVPEHLTAGLGLPLFGVVPRMLRNARNHRGGHLWTPGTPESIEADAYRNLRASLLGITNDKPIVTLLITSAKAGEGKSTTALNLAATCARAGERTLLMDVDLRRPSLNDVFPGNENGTGLVDILRGDLPWQRTVIQTDLPNLDFLPTGDPRDVPIEVLGSLELRQLLISLSEHHYDRVILDGPAVLGLADCRMLGRIVDGAVMVVRSGSQELRPLQRAKAMLEQSRVPIVGLIFNGLNEDLQNWSSYGPNPMLDPTLDLASGRSAGGSAGLDAPNSRAASLMAVGSADS